MILNEINLKTNNQKECQWQMYLSKEKVFCNLKDTGDQFQSITEQNIT